DPDHCCALRKTLPLRRFLADKRAWITGLRRDQSPARAATGFAEWDATNGLVKLNPLAAWTEDLVWQYIHFHDLPYNRLHDKGYPSLGCMPCTRAVRPGEDPRAGRWPGFAKTECGIHLQPKAA
ncbi:MAG TPA: phosphoadenylyl-sulfate reductase, partial [Rhodothermales bacterium]|nr:phosphoadenylyl-sulfate reductase [Rhodothermales bacterium]